jgi:multiple sugar transport system permease protein
MITRSLRHSLIGYGFLLPNIIGFLLFTLGPIVFSFFISFFNWDLFARPVFVDTANYETIFTAPGARFWSYLGNSLFFLIVVPVQMAVALVTAWLLDQNLKGTLLFKVLFFIPVVLSVVSISIVWEYILDTENGFLNQLLVFAGMGKVSWLYDPAWIKAGISLMVVWQGSAFGTIIYYAALQGIPDQLYEAAILDGAGQWAQFMRITVPLLAPTHVFLAITGCIGALQLFAPIYVMTHANAGAAHNLIFEVYWKGYHEFTMGYAAALSWVLFLLVFILTGMLWKYFGRRTDYA